MAHYRPYHQGGYHEEREPLEDYHRAQSRSPGPRSPYHDQDPYYQQQPQQQQQQQQQQQHYPPQGYHYEDPVASSPRHQPQQQYNYHQDPQYRHQEPPPPPQHAGGHPDSSFQRLRSERQQQNSRGQGSRGQYAAVGAAAGAGAAGAGYAAANYDAPQPPPHGNNNWGVTPGADNFGPGASGGMSGIAYNVADQNARESGMEAARGYDNGSYNEPSMPQQAYYSQSPRPSAQGLDRDSHSSLTPIGGGGAPPGMGTPTRTPLGYGAPDPYSDSPYQSYSYSASPRHQYHDQNLGVVNPNDIADDGDDGLGYRKPQRTSMLSLSHSDRNSSRASVAAGAAAAGGLAGAVGAGAAARNNAEGYYVPSKNNSAFDVGGGGPGGPGGPTEKSEWMEGQKSNKKKWKWIAIVALIVVVVGAIVGGTVGALFGGNNGGRDGSSSGGGGGQSADEDLKENGDLDKNSQEIKALMSNDKLHKVFPGFDYTPVNVQYPYCIHDPPSQNNITRDIAVLSQLTDVVRLYGTDCNQTQMVIHAMDQLDLRDTMGIWMGVWIDGNSSTNARQLSQMWDILDEYGEDPFEGLIVANEILFRKEMDITELGELLDEVRTNLTDKGMSLPVATSDLGDDWSAGLANSSDYIMSNIHPFFAGVPAKEAASWTWSFWENNNKEYWKSENERNIIAEIGWPTAGGTNCGDGTATNCPDASVANVSGLNQLLEDWVCQAMENKTEYLWFSAFDEPWKARFDEKDKEWESKWGLMDVDRNIKDGVEIPDCNGKTWDRKNSKRSQT